MEEKKEETSQKTEKKSRIQVTFEYYSFFKLNNKHFKAGVSEEREVGIRAFI